METVKKTLEKGTLDILDLEAVFSDLSQAGFSLMIRSDVARKEKIYTCAISSVYDADKSARNDADSLDEAVVSALASMFRS